MTAFVERLVGRLEALPGVQSAAATNAAPLSRSTDQTGAEPENAEAVTNLLVDQIHVTPRYFQAMGIRLLGGRDFTWQDRTGDLGAIVDDVLARAAWPNQSPVGKYVSIDGRRRVIGVVRQPRLYEVHRNDRPQIFVPYAERRGITLVIRAKDPARLGLAVRQAIWAEDPAQPVAAVRLMRDTVDQSLSDRRLTMLLLLFFAALALLLATIGMYGVVAHVVGQRTREIGIRMALGAERSAIRGMVVKHAMRRGVNRRLTESALSVADWGRPHQRGGNHARSRLPSQCHLVFVTWDQNILIDSCSIRARCGAGLSAAEPARKRVRSLG